MKALSYSVVLVQLTCTCWLQRTQPLPSYNAHPTSALQLHHYPWWRASGDGRRLGLFYYPLTEQHFTLLSHYYDLPSLSVRTALHPLMRNGVDGFKVGWVCLAALSCPAWHRQKGCLLGCRCCLLPLLPSGEDARALLQTLFICLAPNPLRSTR